MRATQEAAESSKAGSVAFGDDGGEGLQSRLRRRPAHLDPAAVLAAATQAAAAAMEASEAVAALAAAMHQPPPPPAAAGPAPQGPAGAQPGDAAAVAAAGDLPQQLEGLEVSGGHPTA